MIIEVNSLEYKYPGMNENALKDIDFAIGKGEIFGFLGPSGSGKSTTQKILFNMLKGYKGSARILGKEVSAWSHELYHHIGVGFELPNHYLKLTAIENLKFFGSFYRDILDPMMLLEKVGLHQDANKKVGEYSKGMKMRLNFIRAILRKPEILFLDEPTSGLDPVNARTIKDMILEQRESGVSVFITTHQMNDADELCDRVAFISDGSLKAIDTPLNLKVSAGEGELEVEFEDSENVHRFPLKGIGNNSEFISQIKERQVRRIHSKEATLDDIFIKITGKKLIQ